MDILIFIATVCCILSSVAYFLFLGAQKERFNKAGLWLMATVFVILTCYIGYKTLQSGHMPVRNLCETLLMAAWALSCVFTVLQFKINLKILGVFAAPLLTVIMLAASMFLQSPVQPKNVFGGFWFATHIISIFTGEAAFALACGAGILYLVQERGIKRKKRGFFYNRLPSLNHLDTAGYVCIVIGFTLVTVGMVTGFVYAKVIWGRLWTWDPKEVWSIIMWIIYAGLLHKRLVAGLRGRRAAIMSIIGFAAVLFTFLGVNFFFKGHHQEFTIGL